MNTGESFRVGLDGLIANKMRASLTMLGIVFGVAAVIAMVSIGEGARIETLRQIELLGTNNILINKLTTAIDNENGNASFSPGLSINDAHSIQNLNPFVESITPLRSAKYTVSYKSKMEEFSIIGTTPNYPETFNSFVTDGSFFKQYHYLHSSSVCVIGAGAKNAFFQFDDAVGKKIKIGDLWFDIIGVVSPKNITTSGMKSFGIRDFNNDIYIPLNTMMHRMEDNEIQEMMMENMWDGGDEFVQMTDKSSVDQITVKIREDANLKEGANLIERILQRKHFDVKDYEVVLPEQLLAQKQKTQRIFNVVMGAIAGISLLVGGIGIMNIMLANIMERTREIGVRRAVGATKADILTQFMFEAVIISVIGGILGIATGFILTKLISTYAGWTTVMSPFAIIFAFFVSVTTGVIFGIYPAKQAAEKNPIESLRYE